MKLTSDVKQYKEANEKLENKAKLHRFLHRGLPRDEVLIELGYAIFTERGHQIIRVMMLVRLLEKCYIYGN